METVQIYQPNHVNETVERKAGAIISVTSLKRLHRNERFCDSIDSYKYTYLQIIYCDIDYGKGDPNHLKGIKETNLFPPRVQNSNLYIFLLKDYVYSE